MTTIYVIKIFLVTTLCEVAQLCPTLCDPMDCSLLCSSVHGIFQARVLEWVAISFSRRSSQPRDWTPVSLFIGQTLYCLSHQGSLRSFAICMTTLDHSNHISKKKKNYVKIILLPLNWVCLLVVQFSHSVVSDSLRPCALQHARPPCPSPTPGVHPNPCLSSQWCYPTISSSVIPSSPALSLS